MKTFNISTTKLIFTFIIILTFSNVKAQYGNVWAFGFNYGLDFNTNPPIFFDTTAINTYKGSASVCDSSGQLLFYTDGGRVWNKLHQLMPHGDSMAYSPLFFIDTNTGDSVYNSSFQAAIIIPIENTLKYYIFTTDFYAAYHELKYHVVDMTANSGLGDVIIKNQVLQSDISERLATTRHCNGQDWWVVTRKLHSDEYISILVKPDTVINNPVISHTGLLNNQLIDETGHIKISPNGKWLANTYDIYGGTELAYFDNATGQVNILIQDFVQGWKYATGCAFSADSKYLFSSVQYSDSTLLDSMTGNYVLEFFVNRYFLGSMDSAQIVLSKIRLHQPDSMVMFSALQLAPDGSVYARANTYSIDTSNAPQFWKLYKIDQDNDTLHSFLSSLIVLPTGTGYGLPSFPDAIFTNHHKASLRIPTCIAGVFDSIPFYDSLLTTTRDYIWDFGDPASGLNNTYNGQFPIHSFSAPGTYTVTITLPSDCNPITITQQVIANPTTAITPIITLNSFSLVSTSAIQYQWYLNNNPIAGATNQTFTPISNGNYTVTITDSNSCTQTSAIYSLTTIGLQNINPHNFSIYPNPATNSIYINNPNQKQTSITITDLLGNTIIQANLIKTNESIDISKLSNGIYIITIDNSFNQKLVVNK